MVNVVVEVRLVEFSNHPTLKDGGEDEDEPPDDEKHIGIVEEEIAATCSKTNADLLHSSTATLWSKRTMMKALSADDIPRIAVTPVPAPSVWKG